MNNLENCPCGRQGRYCVNVDGEWLSSCNKYFRCVTYDQLNLNYTEVYKDLQKVLASAQGLMTYKEGTDFYIEDSYCIKQLADKYRQPF